MSTVFTNGAVSISKSLLLGLVVLAEDGTWQPLEYLDDADFVRVDKLIDNNPTFPWKQELGELRNTRK